MSPRLLSPLIAGLLSFAAVLAAAPAGAVPLLRVEGPRFKDAAGRTVFLRGVNVAGDSKVPPFRPASDPAVFEPLHRFGLNVVRLLFTWEAYEPQRGAYDKSYLDYYASAAAAAHEHGLYVIVDLHQDAFSRYSVSGCGEGFPPWALPKTVTPAAPDNGPACASWGVKMQSDQDMMTSWAAFYSDEEGVKTRYLAMLDSVSARLASEPGVIGYDMINEPWGDEVNDIGPFYEQAAAALRKNSPDTILFVSPRALTSAGNQTLLLKPSFDNFAYSPHFYDASVVLFKSWSGVEPDGPFDEMKSKADEWNVPLFLGEFGAPGPTDEGPAYMDSLYRHLDERLSSGAQWVYTPGWTDAKKDGWNTEDFSIVDDKGALRQSFRPRPYPAATAGEPTLFRVTDSDVAGERTVELQWNNDPAAGATQIFLPQSDFFGTNSVTLDIEGEGLTCQSGPLWVECVSGKKAAMRVKVKKGAAALPPEPSRCGLVGIELLALWPFFYLARRRRARPAPRRSEPPLSEVRDA